MLLGLNCDYNPPTYNKYQPVTECNSVNLLKYYTVFEFLYRYLKILFLHDLSISIFCHFPSIHFYITIINYLIALITVVVWMKVALGTCNINNFGREGIRTCEIGWEIPPRYSLTPINAQFGFRNHSLREQLDSFHCCICSRWEAEGRCKLSYPPMALCS